MSEEQAKYETELGDTPPNKWSLRGEQDEYYPPTSCLTAGKERTRRLSRKLLAAGVDIDTTVVAQEHTHKSTTYVFLHNTSGMSLEDAIYQAEELGGVGLGVIGVDIDSVPYDNVVYFTKGELHTALDTSTVVYIGYPLSQKEITSLNKKYTVYPTDTQPLDEHER